VALLPIKAFSKVTNKISVIPNFTSSDARGVGDTLGVAGSRSAFSQFAVVPAPQPVAMFATQECISAREAAAEAAAGREAELRRFARRQSDRDRKDAARKTREARLLRSTQQQARRRRVAAAARAKSTVDVQVQAAPPLAATSVQLRRSRWRVGSVRRRWRLRAQRRRLRRRRWPASGGGQRSAPVSAATSARSGARSETRTSALSTFSLGLRRRSGSRRPSLRRSGSEPRPPLIVWCVVICKVDCVVCSNLQGGLCGV